MICRQSNPTAHHSIKQAATNPRAGFSGPENRPTNKVGALTTCKFASILQDQSSNTHKQIQVRSKIAIERQRLATFEEERIYLTSLNMS